jgi:hypothetical protein
MAAGNVVQRIHGQVFVTIMVVARKYRQKMAAPKPMPSPPLGYRRTMAETALDSCAVRVERRLLTSSARMRFDFGHGDATGVKFRLNYVERRRLHARSVDGGTVQEVFRGGLADIRTNAIQIKEHGTPPANARLSVIIFIPRVFGNSG